MDFVTCRFSVYITYNCDKSVPLSAYIIFDDMCSSTGIYMYII